MCQFIESICCLDGEPKLLRQHQERVNRTFTNFFPEYSPLDLSNIIQGLPSTSKYKCRLQYGAKSHSLDYQQYHKRDIKSLQIVRNDNIDYKFKSTDRSQLDALYAQRKEADDIIIIKNGLVTDSYFANLVFFDGNEWFTPKNPLLSGVKKDFLLDRNKIMRRDIYEKDLLSFTKVSIVNAMLDLGEIEVSSESILF